MARCPSCNKFAAFDQLEPEINDLGVTEAGAVCAEVRIALVCAEDGEELKEANFTVDADHSHDVATHQGAGHELNIDEDDSESTCRTEGRGRGLRTYYGFTLNYTISCACGTLDVKGTLEDEIQASAMDELV